ncbi:hypothetical protein [Brooklawnia sp.]|uniref:hypothetical protein n=1 Tax=Brooklawnia sp. TaxID=2699740 RepID=UPI00312031E1
MNRIVKVARLYLITPISFALVPLLVLAGAFAITLAIFAAIPGDSVRVEGGSQAPMWSLLAIAAIALSHHFPFSQAMSISRREYFAGTMLYATGISLVLALTYLVGGAIEAATDGWGFDAYFFSMPWLWDQGVLVTVALASTAYLMLRRMVV